MLWHWGRSWMGLPKGTKTKREQAVCWERVNSALRGTYRKWQSLNHEWRFFLNPGSLHEQGQATVWSLTRCSTWLKYLYLASTFWKDCWRQTSEKKNKHTNVKRRLLWKNREFYEHNSDVWKKRKKCILPWLMITWKDFHKLMKDRCCVCEWGKGWLNQYWNFTWRKAGFFFVYNCYGGLNECIRSWYVVKSVC